MEQEAASSVKGSILPTGGVAGRVWRGKGEVLLWRGNGECLMGGNKPAKGFNSQLGAIGEK
ncbi:hypothetical protein HanHA89_Chr04g0156551 [Helianthus annuus]|nr:hypothetical protein HanHA89_Chr04g0156551 [Helianthus annuus]